MERGIRVDQKQEQIRHSERAVNTPVAPKANDWEVVALYCCDGIAKDSEEGRLAQKATDDARVEACHSAKVIIATLSVKIKAVDTDANEGMILGDGMNCQRALRPCVLDHPIKTGKIVSLANQFFRLLSEVGTDEIFA